MYLPFRILLLSRSSLFVSIPTANATSCKPVLNAVTDDSTFCLDTSSVASPTTKVFTVLPAELDRYWGIETYQSKRDAVMPNAMSQIHRYRRSYVQGFVHQILFVDRFRNCFLQLKSIELMTNEFQGDLHLDWSRNFLVHSLQLTRSNGLRTLRSAIMP